MRLLAGKDVLVGAIDVASNAVEAPEEVAQTIRARSPMSRPRSSSPAPIAAWRRWRRRSPGPSSGRWRKERPWCARNWEAHEPPRPPGTSQRAGPLARTLRAQARARLAGLGAVHQRRPGHRHDRLCGDRRHGRGRRLPQRRHDPVRHGSLGELKTEAGKIFAGFYAIFSGLFIVVATGFLLTPILHRIGHILHVEDEERRD